MAKFNLYDREGTEILADIEADSIRMKVEQDHGWVEFLSTSHGGAVSGDEKVIGILFIENGQSVFLEE